MTIRRRGFGGRFTDVQEEALAYHRQAAVAFEMGERPLSFMVDGSGPASATVIRRRLELIEAARARRR